jgi:hypothetical protein
MQRPRHLRFFAALSAVAFVATMATSAPAAGYYNLPGSFCQCFGYGNGAGYHSCLVLGPSTCNGWCAPNEVRLECPPRPPYAYYGSPQCNSMNSGTWIQEPVQVEPAVAEPTPAPSAARPQVHARPRFW